MLMDKDHVAPPAPELEPLRPFVPAQSVEQAALDFHRTMALRRSVRHFASTPVSRSTIEACIAAAGTAPSGANKQPWRFVAVSNPIIKKRIRVAAEAEEREFYSRRATPEWLADLAPLGTDADKAFLEVAPWLIVVFKLTQTDPDSQGWHDKVYYAEESVGIASGMLITAIHLAGLVTLTHTPSPLAFLSQVLDRPAHERPYLLLPVGYPANPCSVPAIHRKPLSEILVVEDGVTR